MKEMLIVTNLHFAFICCF